MLLTLGASLAVMLWAIDAWRTHSALLSADPNAIPENTALMKRAVGHGRAIYSSSCEGCHRTGGKGDSRRGIPDLTDGDWLYGGGLPVEIERTVTYGIRSLNPKGWNLAVMPGFARAVPSATQALSPLTPNEIHDIVEYLISLEGGGADLEAKHRGAALFTGRGACYDCHAADGSGDSAIGAPNLTDHIWLYGTGSREDLNNSIAYGRAGSCPAWIGRLSGADIRAVALYIFSLSHRPKTGEAW